MEQEEIKARIAELKARYAKLRAICGPRVLGSETIERYAEEIESLETKLKT